MKQKLLRLTAMLMFGCMVASSIPTGMVQAEESVQADENSETVEEPEHSSEPADSAEDSAGKEKSSANDAGKAETQPEGSESTSQDNAQEEQAAPDVTESSDDSENVPVEGTENESGSDDAAAIQSEDSASDGNSNEMADQSQEDSVIEKNANEINYVFVESPYLETPGTERIAVSYGDGTETVSDASLTVKNDAGEELVWDLSVSAGQIYLFTYDFSDELSTGTYEVVSLNITDEEGERSIALSDSGMEACFGVNEEYDGIEELAPLDIEDAVARSVENSAEVEATVAEIDPENVEESAEKIVDALEEAEEQTEASDLSASLEDNASVNGRTASKSTTGSAASLMAALGARIQRVAAAKAKTGDGNIVVALDPGHDSTHTGASYGNLKEEVLTLKIAKYCKEELEKYSGVTVYMTRTTAACPHPNNSSSGGDIGDRVIAAVDAGASIFVSIHLNSSTSSSPNGAEVIIPNGNWKPQVAKEGKELAQAILKELQSVGLNLRPDEIYSKDTTIGEKYPDGSASDYFSAQIYAKEAGIPGIIVEHAFLTNSGDRTYLDSDADLKKLGVADATGIAKYLGLSKDGWNSPVLTGISTSASGTTVSWNAVKGASGYSVYRRVSGGGWTLIGSSTTTNYVDKSKLSNGTTYYYTVRAYKGAWDTAYSNRYNSNYWTGYDTTGAKAIYTSMPVLDKTTVNATTGVKISWNAVPGVGGYAVYRKNSGGSWAMIGHTSSTSYIDKTAVEGKDYYYTVRAYRGTFSTADANKYGASYWSSYDSSGIKANYMKTPVLSGITISGSTKTLSWGKVSGATGYAVYRKVEGGNWNMLGTTTSRKYEDKETLSSSKVYYYTVRAYRGNVNTALANKYIGEYWSYFDTEGVKSTSLAIPVLQPTKAATSAIQVCWDRVTGASGYAVFRKISGGNWNCIGNTTSTNYIDKNGMSNGKQYYYTVRAYVGDFNIAKANRYKVSYWSGYDTEGVKGRYTSIPLLKSVTVSSSGRTISWSGVSGATGYAVYRKPAGGSWGMIGTSKTTEFNDVSKLSNKTTYYYTVRAYVGSADVAKENRYSSEYWGYYDTSGLKITFLNTPVLDSAKVISSGIQITWKGVTGASGYAVYRKAEGGSWGCIGNTSSSSYTDASNLSGNKYYYTVRSYVGNFSTAKANRYSAAYWSGYDSAGVEAKRLASPSLKNVTSSASGITVSWNSVSGATGYAVYRKVEGGSWTSIGTTESTNYTDKSGMTNGRTYYYTVRAYSGNKTTAIANRYSAAYWSYYDTVGKKITYIGTPVLHSTQTAVSGIIVNWNGVSGVSGYAVYRKTAGGSWAMIGTTTATTYTDKNSLKSGVTYYYTVRAYVGSFSTANANRYNAAYWSAYNSSGSQGKYTNTPALKSAVVTNSGIQISWNGSSGATGYAVYRKTAGGSWAVIGTTTSQSYTDTTSGSDGTTYYYTVRAYVGNYSTAQSNRYNSLYWSHYITSGVSGSTYAIEGRSSVTVSQMVKMYNTYSPISYPSDALSKGGASSIEQFAQIFYEEASAENIKAEVAWCQAMLETGYLKFGGDVKISQFNFAGLGATGGEASGATFSNVREGVRAQIQHLKAYASSTVTESSLKYALVDPRFQYVQKGCAKYVEILGQKENPSGNGWATSKGYGTQILNLIKKMKSL